MRLRTFTVLLASALVAVAAPSVTADPLADPIMCPILAVLYPPQGDIPCVWDCPPYGAFRSPRGSHDCLPHAEATATAATLWIHRFPSVPNDVVPTARLVEAPAGYTCWDARTGQPVIQGDALAVPNPGVRCDPIIGSNRCVRVGAGGYANAGIGTIVPTSACSSFAASHPMTLPTSPGGRTTASGEGTTTWSCTVAESPTVQLPITDYWVSCDINIV